MQKETVNRLTHDGKIGTHYKLWFLNIILSILTLGIYSFWGKTRLRKYSVASFSLLNDRFEYTGTGGELFKGFLKAMGLLFLFLVAVGIVSAILTKAIGMNAAMVNLITGLFINLTYAIVIFMAIYATTRYRYSRTKWRGIRARLDGSAKDYALLSIGRILLNIVTLGFLIPHSQLKTYSYMTNNSYFGSAKAEFKGEVSPLIKINIITLLLFIPTLGFARFWYQAALIRHLLSHTYIASVRIACRYTGMRLLKLVLSNLAILILTLGFGFPIIIWRNLRFMAEHIAIVGDIDMSQVQQSSEESSSIGEGIDEALDLGTGFI